MTGLDTNVWVRYFVQDDPEQARKATQIIESPRDEEETLYINHIVLCETVWVLSYGYKYAKSDLIMLIEQLLLTQQIEIEDIDLVRRAFRDYQRTSADFADCLIGVKNKEAGCRTTASFDAAALRLETFRSPGGLT